MNDDSFYSGTDNQFVLSYELICLLQWLMNHDTEKLKTIITHALASGLKEEIQRTDTFGNIASLEEIQESIIDFFSILETILAESLSEQAVKKAIEKNLMPSIDHIDTTFCDDATVRFSVEKVSSDLEKYPEKNPKDILFKELLRRWKPNKKNLSN